MLCGCLWIYRSICPRSESVRSTSTATTTLPTTRDDKSGDGSRKEKEEMSCNGVRTKRTRKRRRNGRKGKEGGGVGFENVSVSVMCEIGVSLVGVRSCVVRE